MAKIKIAPATADALHKYALTLGYKDVPIPPSSKFERHRIIAPEDHEMGTNEFIFFYNSRRGVTLYGKGDKKLLADFLESEAS